MNATTARPTTPWHLWLVGLIALIFTLFGAYDYYMTQIGDREYLAAAMAPMGVDAETALAYYSSFPLWMEAVWAIGVWSGVAGAVLLLLRSRLAFPAFVISLAAFVISNLYGFVNPMPDVIDPTMTLVMICVVFVVMLLLAIYAWRMQARGVLR